jgi:DNA (cytosine-5)-methyltransferase 1
VVFLEVRFLSQASRGTNCKQNKPRCTLSNTGEHRLTSGSRHPQTNFMNYYNEIDPYAAAWLRNLSDCGLIPKGDVDERSIVDVRPSDLGGYTQCHFFAGIAGWSYALHLAGWPTDRQVWTGSCPCQPFSPAGLQAGTSDERHLWPSFFWLIAQCKPSIVFGEQVASKLGRDWFSGVRSDLETLGYAVGAADLCAAGVGAPHGRQRLYFVADSQRDKQPRKESCSGPIGRVGWEQQPVPWDRSCESALREFRAMDNGLSYGVASTDAARNAIVPQVAQAFIEAYIDSRVCVSDRGLNHRPKLSEPNGDNTSHPQTL